MTDDELMLALYDEHKAYEEKILELTKLKNQLRPHTIGKKFDKDGKYVLRLVQQRTRRLNMDIGHRV